MSLANMRDLLTAARAENRAVGAFSVSSIDMICGPVLCIKRAKNFEESIQLMNRNPSPMAR